MEHNNPPHITPEWEKESTPSDEHFNMPQNIKMNVDPSIFGQALTLVRSKYSQRSDASGPPQPTLQLGPILKHCNSSVTPQQDKEAMSVSDYLINSNHAMKRMMSSQNFRGQHDL